MNNHDDLLQIRPGSAVPTDRNYAVQLTDQDPLAEFRNEFLLPPKNAIGTTVVAADDEPCTYFVASAIGPQPRAVAASVQHFLQQWATQGMFAGMKTLPDSPLPNWLEMETLVAGQMAGLIGAIPSETVVMSGLSTNLHILMASFYRPQGPRKKIILEREAFSSDYIAVESHLEWHGFAPKDHMILIDSDPLISHSDVIATIDEHAETAALILLSGVQFRTGQMLDIAGITAHARSKSIAVGWDLAHVVGNVELHLHDWDVDFAVWCSYKYLNCGPGSLAGCFIHERHGHVDGTSMNGRMPQLAGWWGNAPADRFKMENVFHPAPGAAGWQTSNPSILDLAAMTASLAIFERATMPAIRRKSVQLTGYLEALLRADERSQAHFEFITSSNPAERGAQLSLRLDAELLPPVMASLDAAGIVVDVRRPDILRVTPAPLFNTFLEVWEFVQVFQKSVLKATSTS